MPVPDFKTFPTNGEVDPGFVVAVWNLRSTFEQTPDAERRYAAVMDFRDATPAQILADRKHRPALHLFFLRPVAGTLAGASPIGG